MPNIGGRFVAVLMLICATMLSKVAYSQILPGHTGSAAGDNWQSSWLDIKPPISFKKGEIVKIKVEGSAENVLVRFLPEGSEPTMPDGIEGDVSKVPANRVLLITLTQDHPNIKQISVHAGREAFGRPLGANNGRIFIISVERGK